MGTISVDKYVLEIPFRTGSDSRYEQIIISGTVEGEVRGHYMHLLVIEPGGKTSEQKVTLTRDGNWQLTLAICCNKIGEWTVQDFFSEMGINYIVMVKFDVVLKQKSEPTYTPPTPTPTPIPTITGSHN